MKCIKTNCFDCNKFLGLKFDDDKPKRCRICRSILLQIDPTKNPMYGRSHINRARFRIVSYANVDYEDRIIKYSVSGNIVKKYKMSCTQCGYDRGYKVHYDAIRVCKKCRDKNATCYTKERKRLRCCMKANLVSRLKYRLINKNKKSTFDILNYTVDDLKKHLESKFQPGMTWDNYGHNGWEIDHITPDSWFKYNSIDDKDFKQCWALENLQPLWTYQNRHKGNKYKG